MEDVALDAEQVRWLVDAGTLIVLPLALMNESHTLLLLVEDSVPIRTHTVRYVPSLERLSHTTIAHRYSGILDIQRALHHALDTLRGERIIISPSGYRHCLLRDYTHWAASASMADYITLVLGNIVRNPEEIRRIEVYTRSRPQSTTRERHVRGTLMELAMSTSWCLDSIQPIEAMETVRDRDEHTPLYPSLAREMLTTIQARMDAYNRSSRVYTLRSVPDRGIGKGVELQTSGGTEPTPISSPDVLSGTPPLEPDTSGPRPKSLDELILETEWRALLEVAGDLIVM